MVALLVIATLVPVIVLGTTTFLSLRSLDRDTERITDETTVESQTSLANEVLSGVGADLSRTMDQFVLQQWGQVQVWGQIPSIVDAADAATVRAEQLGLNEMSMEEVEERFLLTREMGGDTEARFLLQGLVADNPYIIDAFFTDANGYVVAYANKPSDFVQSDEEWWQAVQPVVGDAINNRSRVNFGDPEFDESAGAITVDITVPLYDRQGDRTFGALKAELELTSIQDLADAFADSDQGIDITIAAPNGVILAETASRHDATRIMEMQVEIPADREPIIDENGVRAFVQVSEVRSGAGFSTLGQSLNWDIIVEADAKRAQAAAAPLQLIGDNLSDANVAALTILVIIGLIVTAGAVVAAFVFSRRLTTPITELQERAEQVATTDLPRYIAQIQEADIDTELPHMAPIDLATGDELELLANSFNLMQDTAARLAAEQAQMRRRNVATTFVSLGRRNQNLLGRQLKFIDELEQKETDTALLESLFKLDHLATRMRRNAESLLVLAGEDPPRRWNHPVSVQNVVRAAAAEIEDYRRVRIRGIEDAAVQGDVATEVTHLLAELIENASNFSPPGTEIEVFGRVRGNHYRISVVDHGVGMSDEELVTANERATNPVAFDQAPSAFLGLFVVGHLADKHDIRVELQPTAPEGTTVQVEIPLHLIAGVEVAVAPEAPLNRAEKNEAERAAAERAEIEVVPDPGDDIEVIDSEPDAAPTPALAEDQAATVTSAELAAELAGDADAELAALAEDEDEATDAGLATTKSGFKVRKPGSHTKVRPRKGPKDSVADNSERTAETVRDSLSKLRSGVDRAVNDSTDR